MTAVRSMPTRSSGDTLLPRPPSQLVAGSAFSGHVCPACCGSGHGRGYRPCGRCHGDGWLVPRLTRRQQARAQLAAIGA
jgi:hypothetical protein